ncbi:MAG: hypothetical protein ABL930_08090, partial [Pseudobdellovibrio sp.]
MKYFKARRRVGLSFLLGMLFVILLANFNPFLGFFIYAFWVACMYRFAFPNCPKCKASSSKRYNFAKDDWFISYHMMLPHKCEKCGYAFDGDEIIPSTDVEDIEMRKRFKEIK